MFWRPMASQDDKFIKGAATLTVAGLVVKLIGALYRIPLYAVLGGEGMGLFGMAYPIYSIILTTSSAGLNVAISKAVAERWAMGRKEDARSVFRVSLFLMAAVGALGSAALYGLRNFIAVELARDPRAAVSIAAISPALFMASVLSALRGWFQGIEEMTVPAVSQVLEQVGRLATMLLLARALMVRGLEYAAAGATFGAVVGAGLGVLYAAAAYRSHLLKLRSIDRRARRRQSGERGQDLPLTASETWGSAARAVLSVAIPISLASAVFGLTELVDLSLVPGRLQASGLPREQATMLYGQLTQAALPLVNLATIFTGAIQMAIVPSVTGAIAVGDRKAARRRMAKAVSITLFLALPAALGLYVLAGPIPYLLYGEPGLAPVLRPAAPAILFLALQQVTAGALQGLGRVTAPLINLGIAVLVKIVLTYVLVALPGVGVSGAALATSVYFAVAALLNFLSIHREIGNVIEIGVLPKMAFAGVVLVHKVAVPTLGAKLAVVPAVGAGVVIYGMFALALGTFGTGDLEAIPGLGRIVGRLAKRKR